MWLHAGHLLDQGEQVSPDATHGRLGHAEQVPGAHLGAVLAGKQEDEFDLPEQAQQQGPALPVRAARKYLEYSRQEFLQLFLIQSCCTLIPHLFFFSRLVSCQFQLSQEGADALFATRPYKGL